MQYTWTGITPVRDNSGNVTGFRISFNGSDSDQNYLNGVVLITMDQFKETDGNVDKINDLINPAVSALLSVTTSTTTIQAS